MKIDLGCHVDGYIASAAHTVVVGGGEDGKVGELDDDVKDVCTASYMAMKVAAEFIKPGNKNSDVTEALSRVSEAYGVKFIGNVRMHQMKQYVIDGSKEIALMKHDPDSQEEKVETCTFEENEVYCVDVAMSTGEGKGREGDDRTTVFKRNVDKHYKVKMKSSHYVLKAVQEHFPTMPFTLRMMDDERQAKMGVQECVNHELLTAYPVFNERENAHVGHFKCTVLLMPTGNKVITGHPLPQEYESAKELDEENRKVLDECREREEKKKKKQQAKKNKNKKKK